MIVPAPRALRLFFALLPAAAAAALFPQAGPVLAGSCLLVAALAATDALRAARSARLLAVDFPDRLALSQDREELLFFRVSHAGRGRRLLAAALPLPEGVASGRCQLPMELPPGEERLRVGWPLTGRRRGDFSLAECRLRLLSPLGFWHAQRSLPVATALTVYPNLRQERRRLAALFLNRSDLLVRPQRQVGQGREFEKLRLYLPGDSPADIHWRATAKRGQLVSKEFRIERTQEVYAIVDASRMSGRSAGAEGSADTLLDRYIRSALILGSVAHRQGDLFGVAAFADRPLGFVPAKLGTRQAEACRDALYGLTAGQGNPGYDQIASFLAAHLKRRALLIFLTSLDEPALNDGFVRSIRVLSRRHLVCVAMMRPPGALPLFTGDGVGEAVDLYRALAGHLVWHDLRELKETLKLSGVQLFLVEEERFTADMVTRYLDVKRRQLL